MNARLFSPHFLQREWGFLLNGETLSIAVGIYIQEILGYQHCKTTEIYTHFSTKSIGKIKSPLR
jgi:site-specific recombinase XerD